ncbi:MAG: hypothetical protein IT553_02540 [Sphingomonadaceae bacterium]|nr:hypothetical protein [Sphingomonadaceae bacterium]
MLKKRLEVARAVTRELRAAEDAVDTSVDALTSLLGSMTDGRRKAGLSALHGADALESVTTALAQIGKARSALVEAHVGLSRTQREIGLAAYAVGPWLEKPKASNAPDVAVGNDDDTGQSAVVAA